MGIPLELERPLEPCLISRHFQEFAHLGGEKREYTQETHRSCRNSHRRAHGLNPGGPWLEIYGAGARWAHLNIRSALFLLK